MSTPAASRPRIRKSFGLAQAGPGAARIRDRGGLPASQLSRYRVVDLEPPAPPCPVRGRGEGPRPIMKIRRLHQ